ncbi:hypothetical protein HII31_00053 [Pseudocercospora fuligena]|uniref:Uncharacterized protein n=1 Tax=Pseudocercospora fuligena TaxID=685502 RepID=A0A8H6VRW5_9PEZI|nr:hypothetical protein HII31_00053 [Pseudocercospora fuligena]
MSACVEARPPGGSSEQAVLQSKKTFPFFKLPRELRDDVYGRCTQRGDLLEMYCDFSNVSDAGVDVAAEPGLRLVSRQFKQEYEEEIARHPGSRSAWIALESAGTPDEEAGDDSEYGPPRDLDALGRLLSNVEVLRVTYRSYELEKDGTFTDWQSDSLGKADLIL